VKNRDCSSYGFPTDNYDASTVWSLLVRTVHDVLRLLDDYRGDTCTVLQDVTTTVLRLPTYVLYIVSLYDLAASRSRRQLTRNSAVAETALQGALGLVKVEEWDWDMIFCGHLQSLSHNRPAKLSNSVKKNTKKLLCRLRSFKVTEVGTNRKPVCDFLLVINSN